MHHMWKEHWRRLSVCDTEYKGTMSGHIKHVARSRLHKTTKIYSVEMSFYNDRFVMLCNDLETLCILSLATHDTGDQYT